MSFIIILFLFGCSVRNEQPAPAPTPTVPCYEISTTYFADDSLTPIPETGEVLMVYPYETLYDIDLVEGQRVKFTIKFLPNCGDKNILKAQNVGEEHAPYFWDIRINGTSIFTPTFTPEPTKTIDPTAPTATSTPTFDPTAPTPTPLPTINHSYVFDYIVPAYNPLNPTNIFVKAQFYTSDKQDKQKILDISKDVFPKVKNIP